MNQKRIKYNCLQVNATKSSKNTSQEIRVSALTLSHILVEKVCLSLNPLLNEKLSESTN